MPVNAQKDLLRQAASGNKLAADLLWYMESANILQKVMSFVEDRDEAYTIAAEVMALAIKRSPSYAGKSKFFTWVLTLICNHIKDCGNRFSGYEGDAMSRADTGDEESASLLISTETVYSLTGNITDNIYDSTEDRIVSEYNEDIGYGEED